MNALIVLNLAYGVIRPLSLTFCENVHQTINNIVDLSKEFDFCFLINDNHSQNDNEFRYLPPHMISVQDKGKLLNIEPKLSSRNRPITLYKNTLNAFNSRDNKEHVLGYNFDSICIAGFSATLDVVPTTLGIMDFHPNVFISELCVGDISLGHKSKALDYLNFLGVKILKDKNVKGIGFHEGSPASI